MWAAPASVDNVCDTEHCGQTAETWRVRHCDGLSRGHEEPHWEHCHCWRWVWTSVATLQCSILLSPREPIYLCVCVSIIRRRMKLWILNGMEIEWRRCRRSVRKHRVEQRRLELEHNNVLQLARYSDQDQTRSSLCHRHLDPVIAVQTVYNMCLMSIVNCYRFALGPTKGGQETFFCHCENSS